jgi:hydrogenase/urease accessory protein HupE
MVFGHTTGLSTADVTLGTNGINAEVILAGADLTLALAQLETDSPSDKNHDGTLNSEEFVAGIERLRKFAAGCLVVEFDGQLVRPAAPQLKLDDKDNFHIELTYPGDPPQRVRVRAALFAHLPANHLHFVSIQDANGKVLGNKMLKPSDDALEITCPTGSTQTERRASTFTDFLKLGVEHIWTGYDHLLFLLALLLVCTDFKSAIQVVTFFTVAHSITLAFATLNLVTVSNRVVEPAIAASIVYVGAENFVRSEGPKGRWLITFLFGLIHGFGFATVLRDMGVASSTTGVTVPLVAFNLGVEIGQVVIATVLLPLIWQLRKWKSFLKWGVPACSGIVAVVGGYWLIQRVFFG